MKKILVLAAIFAIVFAMPLIAGGASEGGSSTLRFGTGGDQGTYYGFGNVLAQKISSETDTSVVAVVSAGSQDNIEMMDMGSYQLGFVQTDVMSYAYNGTNLFAQTGAISDFSTVAALYMEQVQIVTLDPAIKTVADLKGKTQAFITMPLTSSVHTASQKMTSTRHTRVSETVWMPFRTARSMQHSWLQAHRQWLYPHSQRPMTCALSQLMTSILTSCLSLLRITARTQLKLKYTAQTKTARQLLSEL